MGYVIQQLRADNDENGNPQRVWLVYDTETGSTVAAYDEEYLGKRCVPDEYRSSPELEPIKVSIDLYEAALIDEGVRQAVGSPERYTDEERDQRQAGYDDRWPSLDDPMSREF